MHNETLILDRPFDFTVVHRAIGMIRHTDDRSTIDCQCGRGCTGLTEADARARWAAHMAEVSA